MIKIENLEVVGLDHAIRGMRNPMNSWKQSDSEYIGNDYDDFDVDRYYHIGPNDLKLMNGLRTAGSDHRKFMRMIVVYVDITAPLYWWKEFDTYKVGTVANSCSTMHKIHDKEFTLDDFSYEHLWPYAVKHLRSTISLLNDARGDYIDYDTDIRPLMSRKDCWWQMIQLLPSSYNQKRTIMLNYEVLTNMYNSRKNHKLDEWKEFCEWIKDLPYAKEIILGKEYTEEVYDNALSEMKEYQEKDQDFWFNKIKNQTDNIFF